MTTYTKASKGISVTNGTPQKSTAVPAVTTDTLLGVSCCNTYTTSIKVTVEILKADSTAFCLAKSAEVPVGDTLWVGGNGERHILETTDTMRFTVNTTSGTCDFVYSYQREV